MKRKLWKLICPAALLLILLALSLALAVPASAATYESFTTSGSQVYASRLDESWAAQTFTTTSAHNVTAVVLYMARESSYMQTVIVSITATDGNGYPTGGDLASGTIDPSSISTGGLAAVTVLMTSSYELSNNTKYAIVIRGLSFYASPQHYLYLQFNVNGGYAGGSPFYRQSSFSSWQSYYIYWGFNNADILFQIQDTTVSSNTPPTSSNNAVTILEETPKVFAVADFPFSDANTGDVLSKVKITTLESAGTLKYNGTDVSLDQEITAADITDGKLTFDPAANANGSPYATFGFKVSDGQDYSTSAYIMTINVLPRSYTLSVTTNPVSIASTTGGGTYSASAVVSISAAEYVDITAGQSRYHFTGWTGTGVAFGNAALPSTTITMPAGTTTITSNYVTQYKVHYAVTGNTLTITVPADEWVNSGSGAIGSFPARFTNTACNIRDNFVSDSRSAVPPGISGPTTVTATYQTQYLVHYATTGAVLTVTVPADEWANSGAAVTGTFPAQVVNAAGNTRCNYVSNDRPVVPPGVTSPITLTATYQTQYSVVLGLNRGGFGLVKTDGIGTVLKVNGSIFACSDLPFSGWFSAGSSLNYEFTAVMDGASGVKYGWVGNGGMNILTERANNITVNAHTITQAMYLSYGVTVSPGSGQYSDKVSFAAQVGPYLSSGFTYPTDVHFYVGTQDIGSVDLSPKIDEVTYAVTKCGSLDAPLLETLAGQLAAGSKAVTAKWDNLDSPLNPTTSLVITREDATPNITSSSTLETGSVTVKAALLADGTSPISGRTVNFAAGSANATGTTNSTGTASATLSLPPGQYTLTASFAGDSYYQPGNATAQTLYVYQPTTFVIWGGNAGGVAAGQGYVFWGAQWIKQVKAGDFQANSSFKGYADTVNSSTKTWTTGPGNSSNPPATISSYISVIVSTHIAKNGSTISGNINQVVVLRVDNPASYKTDPGSTGSGVLAAVLQ